MHYGWSCAIFESSFHRQTLTKFWVEIIIYTCKPAVLGRNNDIYL